MKILERPLPIDNSFEMKKTIQPLNIRFSAQRSWFWECLIFAASMLMVLGVNAQAQYSLSKSIAGIAESGTPGQVDVTYEVVLTNDSLPFITDLQITDNAEATLGAAFIGVSQMPSITNSTATSNPILNPNFMANGVDANLFSGNSGLLLQSQFVSVSYVITLDLNLAGGDLDNIAVGAASIVANGPVIIPQPADTATLTDCWSNCVMACNNQVNISVNTMCEANILADMLLEGEDEECADLGFYQVEIFDENDNPVALPLGSQYIGRKLSFTVTNVSCGNSCWGNLFVSDQTPPLLNCDSDTLACSEDISPFNPNVGFPVPLSDIMTTMDSNRFIAASVDACGEVELVYRDSLVARDCSDTVFSSVLYRIWRATDASGLTVRCTDTIFFTRGTLADVMLPPHYDGTPGNEPPLQCDGNFCTLPNGFPAPEDCGTGAPAGIFCGNIQYDYWDDTIKVCESSYKLFRNWIIIDWCNPDEKIEFIQRIKVVDEDGPVVIAPPLAPLVLGMDDYYCGRKSYIVPVPVFDPTGANAVANPYIPTILEECGTWTYTVQHLSVDETIKDPSECATVDNSQIFSTKNVRQLPNGRWELFDIPVGCNWIKYLITDDCGNTTEFSFDLFIEDDIDPVAVCHEHTVVALTSEGKARVRATTFDDGSHDNCGLGLMEVRRMVNGNCPSNVLDDTQFREYVEFCCEDIADNPVMVVLRVWDECGNNFSECMVEVTVQDKLPPVITFCPGPVRINCEDDYTPLSQFGTAEAFDNCNVVITEDSINNLNDCGVGTIIRIFTATDDGGRQATCSQVITVVDDNPFNVNDITWPPNRELFNGCMEDTDPDNTGEPTFRNLDQCNQIAVSYDDLVFNQVDGACLKILRKWRVVDWCQFDKTAPDECYPLNAGRWCYTQVIKVHDDEGPEITSDCGDRTECITGGACQTSVTLEATAFDACTPSDELIWTYMIDLDQDGTFDVTGRRNSFTRIFDGGTYTIKWTVEDNCGNIEECSYELTVEDCKEPTPYCKNGITTVIMPSTGTITLWASDFDAGSFDNCTDSSDLVFSFSDDINETNRVFTCDDIENGVSDTIEVTIYVWDETGRHDFCVTQLILQDNQDVCPNATFNGMIAGLISTDKNDVMKDVEVVLSGHDMPQTKSFMTDDNGHFEFPDVEMYHDYKLIAKHNQKPLNGVSSKDLVMMQKHLLGLEEFTSPYQYIAADVNNSESLSAGDIAELRKMILGLYANFPSNDSWRFVDQDFVFQDPKDPFPFQEEIDFSSFDKDEMTSDFVAVKVGDVSGDADPSGLQNNGTRSGKMVVGLKEEVSQNSEQIRISFSVDQAAANEFMALQFTMEFDEELMTFEGLESDVLTIGAENVAQLHEGMVTFSWSDFVSKELNEGEIFMTATFTKQSDLGTILPLGLTSAVTKAAAYDSDLNEYEIGSKSIDGGSRFVLHQNTPNPFRGSTSIGFELPEDVEYSIEVFDMSGKILTRVSGYGRAGYQSIDLDLSSFSESSVLYYQLNTDKYSATRKMVIIE